MQRVVSGVVGGFLVLVLSVCLLLAAVTQGLVEAPEATLWLGPVAISSRYACVARWSMPCTSAGTWTLQLIVRLPGSETRMWRLVRVDPATGG